MVYDGVTYYLGDSDADGVYDYAGVSSCDETVTSVDIRGEVEGIPITEIRSDTFWECSELTSIKIPASVTQIRSSSADTYGIFGFNGKLESIEVAEDNEYYSSIDGVLFNKERNQLLRYPRGKADKQYVIPDGTVGIEDFAFNHCEYLENITIPDSVMEIGTSGYNAFYDTPLLNNQEGPVYYADNWIIGVDYDGDLASAELKEGTVGIAQYMFDFAGIESITIPDSVKHIGKGCFQGNPMLENQTGPIYYADKWVVSADDGVTSVELNDGTRGIADSVFYGHTLESISIPEGLTSIGRTAFYNCCNLSSIKLPDSLTNLGRWAFEGCSALEEVTVPGGISRIPYGLFMNCSGLKKVVLSDGVEKTGEWMFQRCSSLTEIILPDSLKTFGYGTFNRCTSLSDIVIPDSVTKIEDAAFIRCKGFENIELSANVDYIGHSAFQECESLKTITINNPSAVIIDSDGDGCTIANYIQEDNTCVFEGTIYGYENSTAQAYAEKNGYKFAVIGSEPEILKGDADGNGKIAASDAAFIAKLLAKASLTGDKVSVEEYPDADYNGDGKISAQDAALIAKYVAEQALKK